MSVAVADAVDAYVERKTVAEGDSGGTYATNATSILSRWSEWLEAERDVSLLADLSVEHMEAYAQSLDELASAGEYTASTAHTYFAVVRAFLTWCVEGGLIESNPATGEGVTGALPERSHSTSGPWSLERQRRLEAHLNRRVVEADRTSRGERLVALRDKALVAVLTSTGLRGAELFRVPEDERRSGATWEDVDFYDGTIRVLGTSQRLEEVPLPATARTPLRRYRVVLDPPTNEWPLFPTRHAPSIARAVRTALAERGLGESAIEERLDSATAVEVAREEAIVLPAITTEGARSILRRLCEDAGIDLEDGALTPRGARLGVGDAERRAASPTAPALRTTAEQSMTPLEQEIETLEKDE